MNAQGELFRASDYGPSRSIESIDHDIEGISYVSIELEGVVHRLAVHTSDIEDLRLLEEELHELVDWPVEAMNPILLYGLD